jgi:hypothetical protein
MREVIGTEDFHSWETNTEPITELTECYRLFLQSSDLVQPHPSPAGECALHLWFRGGTHTRLRERGWGVPIRTRAHTLWFSRYLCTLWYLSFSLLETVFAGLLGVSRAATTARGCPQGEEGSIPAEGMQEDEAMPESEAAATTTGEVSLAEAGGDLGAAGRSRPTGSIGSHIPDSQKSEYSVF